ncbi:MAG: hypothetical protein ABSD58_08125 [Verrucomicrobiia bacterium]|jgi:hypothetical protein
MPKEDGQPSICEVCQKAEVTVHITECHVDVGEDGATRSGQTIKQLTVSLGAVFITSLLVFVGGCGKRNGHGTVTYPDGRRYDGEFKDGKRNGQGTETLPDGAQYVGEYRDDKANGEGTLTRLDGTKYVGEFKDDKFWGHGTETFPDGTRYVGQFKNARYDDEGTLTFSDGRQFVGQFRNGEGTGTMTYPDGKVEKGVLDQDKVAGGTQ